MHKLRMLIVEDDYLSQHLLLSFVAEYGSCDLADDGRKAVRAVEASYESDKPYDLIFMDIRLPELDGLDAIGEIRALEASHGDPACASLKILMTTAMNDPHFVIEAFKKQCDGYITKPFSKPMLEKEIKKLGLA